MKRSSPRYTPAAAPVRALARWLLILGLVSLAAGCAPGSGGVATSTPAASTDVSPVPTTSAPTEAILSTPEPPTSTPTEVVANTPVPATVPAATAAPSPGSQEPTPIYGYRVVNEYPHDAQAFTQGLVYEDGIFYEGTGLTGGRSSLRKVVIETGEVLQIHRLAPEYFGEGIAVVGDRIWQLTWQNQTAFLYDKETFEQLDAVPYPTEGWGLTYDGERLIMSDGTSTLYFRHPETFELLGQVQVVGDDGPVVRLNELEYIDGQVWANVWQTDRIAIIDPATGHVDAWLDLTGLIDRTLVPQEIDVLNGIAYDQAGDRLFVTGKWWPTVFEIEIVIEDETAYLPLTARRWARTW